ncbi:hypothetical protein SEPCBS57363_006142 [Sporothrix epigloea]|uniref:Myb/SANT-like domain-containing protein n=1 Tax=Sporothrix epigloea TaxID=1892477 RepID=A0ABP0E1Q9_9PEZI
MFNSTQRKLYQAVWVKVAARMNKVYSTDRYTPTIISNKFDTERKRFRLWQSFSQEPGVSYDKEYKHFQVDGNKRWDNLGVKYGGNRPRSIQWLLYKPLGDLAVYKEVFFRDLLPPKENSADSTHDTTQDCSFQQAASAASNTGNPLLSRERDRLTKRTEQTPVQIAADAYEKSPEPLAARPSSTPAEILRCRSANSQKRPDFLQAANNFKNATKTHSTGKKSSLELIRFAVKDFISNFTEGLPLSSAAKCIDQLEKLENAVMWNAVNDDEVKAEFVKCWTEK